MNKSEQRLATLMSYFKKSRLESHFQSIFKEVSVVPILICFELHHRDLSIQIVTALGHAEML